MAATSTTEENDDYEELETVLNGCADSNVDKDNKKQSVIDKLHAVVEEVTSHRIVKPKKLETIGFIQ